MDRQGESRLIDSPEKEHFAIVESKHYNCSLLLPISSPVFTLFVPSNISPVFLPPSSQLLIIITEGGWTQMDILSLVGSTIWLTACATKVVSRLSHPPDVKVVLEEHAAPSLHSDGVKRAE